MWHPNMTPQNIALSLNKALKSRHLSGYPWVLFTCQPSKHTSSAWPFMMNHWASFPGTRRRQWTWHPPISKTSLQMWQLRDAGARRGKPWSCMANLGVAFPVPIQTRRQSTTRWSWAGERTPTGAPPAVDTRSNQCFCSGVSARRTPPSLAFNSRQMLRPVTRTSHRRLDHLRTPPVSSSSYPVSSTSRLPLVSCETERWPAFIRREGAAARRRPSIGGSFGVWGILSALVWRSRTDRSGWSASSSSCSSSCAILPSDSQPQVILLLLVRVPVRAHARFVHRCLLFSRNGRAIRDYCWSFSPRRIRCLRPRRSEREHHDQLGFSGPQRQGHVPVHGAHTSLVSFSVDRHLLSVRMHPEMNNKHACLLIGGEKRWIDSLAPCRGRRSWWASTTTRCTGTSSTRGGGWAGTGPARRSSGTRWARRRRSRATAPASAPPTPARIAAWGGPSWWTSRPAPRTTGRSPTAAAAACCRPSSRTIWRPPPRSRWSSASSPSPRTTAAVVWSPRSRGISTSACQGTPAATPPRWPRPGSRSTRTATNKCSVRPFFLYSSSSSLLHCIVHAFSCICTTIHGCTTWARIELNSVWFRCCAAVCRAVTWQVTCSYSQYRASGVPSCCVSMSTFYSETIVDCPRCSCACQGSPTPTSPQCVRQCKASPCPAPILVPVCTSSWSV